MRDRILAAAALCAALAAPGCAAYRTPRTPDTWTLDWRKDGVAVRNDLPADVLAGHEPASIALVDEEGRVLGRWELPPGTGARARRVAVVVDFRPAR